MSKTTPTSLPCVAELVQLLQTAFPLPFHWQTHLRNLGMSPGAEFPLAEMAKLTERVFWHVKQTGMKDPAGWIANRRAQLNVVKTPIADTKPGTSPGLAGGVGVQTDTNTLPPAQRYRPKIDYALIADGFQFCSHRDRCLYLGKSRNVRRQWIKENTGKYWLVEDLQIEPERLEQPDQPQSVAPAPAQSNFEPAPGDVCGESDDADFVAAPRLEKNSAAPGHPTLPPTPVEPSAPAQLKPQPYAEPAVNEIERPQVVTGPVEATASNQEHSGAFRREKQPAPARRRKARSKAAQARLAELMHIVVESLTERPIYRCAAEKAGIHRKTLAYWLKRSKAGDAGYELEWQGVTMPFHEHCQTAIEIAHDRILAKAWELAMGVRVRVDEGGNLIEEMVGRPSGKMIRFLLPLVRPEKWGDPSKIDRPQTGGVLVLGGPPEQIQTCPEASIKARQWKSHLKKVTEAGA